MKYATSIETETSYRLMVRTLGFHPKNVGSNPASLKIKWSYSIKL